MTNAEMFRSNPRTGYRDIQSDPVANYVDQVESQNLPPLPSPSPTDLSSLFFGQNSRSHARRQNPDHVPRPRNAFILFRCDFVRQRVPDDVISDHRDLSRLAGYMWRQMTDEQKMPWFEKAELEKRYHSQVFPTYRYTPGPLNRPKRVYRRKKPPAQEILLRDPHGASDIERRATSCPVGLERVVQVPLVSAQGTSSSPLTTRDDIVQNFRPSRVTLYQSYPSPRLIETDRNPPVDYDQLPSPSGPLRAGFVQIPREEEGLPEDFTPLGSGRYSSQQAYWHPTPVCQPGHSPTPTYTYSGYSTVPVSTHTPSHGADALYTMWRDLNVFHDQYPQQARHDSSHNYYPCSANDATLMLHSASHTHGEGSSHNDGEYNNRSRDT